MSAAATSADHALAVRAATAAGELLVALRSRLFDGGSSAIRVGDEGDRQAHELLAAMLRQEAPGDAILSEEGFDDPRRLDHERVWIVDPLDGTREFSERPRTDWE